MVMRVTAACIAVRIIIPLLLMCDTILGALMSLGMCDAVMGGKLRLYTQSDHRSGVLLPGASGRRVTEQQGTGQQENDE